MVSRGEKRWLGWLVRTGAMGWRATGLYIFLGQPWAVKSAYVNSRRRSRWLFE